MNCNISTPHWRMLFGWQVNFLPQVKSQVGLVLGNEDLRVRVRRTRDQRGRDA